MRETQDILRELGGVIRDVLMRDDADITLQTTARDIEGWDSMKQIEIVLAAEEHFAVKLSAREIDGLGNVGDFVSVIQSKIG